MNAQIFASAGLLAAAGISAAEAAPRAAEAGSICLAAQEDFTKNGKRYDLILDVKTNRSPFAYLRALNPHGTYVTVGGSIPRLLLALALGRATMRARSSS